MSFPQSGIPGLEELGTAAITGGRQLEEEARMAHENERYGLPTKGKAAAAVIRSTNAKVAALEEQCRILRQLYEDLSGSVRKYVEAHKEESEAARQAEREHQEEMQSMVAAMGLLHQELERAAKESRAVGEAARAAEAEARLKQEAAEKYRQQLEDERKQRQELEMASIKAARERLSLQDQHRGLERECASLKQSVAILEEKCRLKEATFVDADNAAAKMQGELLEWRKKGLALEAQLKQETEEKVVAQRLLELERSRKGPREAYPLRKQAPTAGEKPKTPGNKQPTLKSESSLTKLVHLKPSANQAVPARNENLLSPVSRTESQTGVKKVAPSTSVAEQSIREPSLTSTELSSSVVKQEVEKAVLEALRSAEERCDRAVSAAEARGKQALAEAMLDKERAVRVATMDLEARLRKELVAEKTAIAEAAAAEAMEAAVTAAVEEQESLHKQIEQLQAKLRKITSGVRGVPETVRVAPPISRSHVAAARRQALLKRIPIAEEKGVSGTKAEAALARTVSRLQRSARYGNELPVKQARKEAPEKPVAGNERLQKALDDCMTAADLRSPRSVQSDVERWGSDVEQYGRSLRTENSDTALSYVGWRAEFKQGSRAIETSPRLKKERVPLWERATKGVRVEPVAKARREAV